MFPKDALCIIQNIHALNRKKKDKIKTAHHQPLFLRPYTPLSIISLTIFQRYSTFDHNQKNLSKNLEKKSNNVTLKIEENTELKFNMIE